MYITEKSCLCSYYSKSCLVIKNKEDKIARYDNLLLFIKSKLFNLGKKIEINK